MKLIFVSNTIILHGGIQNLWEFIRGHKTDIINFKEKYTVVNLNTFNFGYYCLITFLIHLCCNIIPAEKLTSFILIKNRHKYDFI